MREVKNVSKCKRFDKCIDFFINIEKFNALGKFLTYHHIEDMFSDDISIGSYNSFVLDNLIRNGFFEAGITIHKVSILATSSNVVKVWINVSVDIGIIEIDSNIKDYYYFIDKLNSIDEDHITISVKITNNDDIRFNIDIVDPEVESNEKKYNSYYFPLYERTIRLQDDLIEDNMFLYNILSRDMDCVFMTSVHRPRWIDNNIPIAQALGTVFNLKYINGKLHVGVLFRPDKVFIDKNGYDVTLDSIKKYGGALPYIEYDFFDNKLNIIDFEIILNDDYKNEEEDKGEQVDNGSGER